MEDTQNITVECAKPTGVFTSVLQNAVPLEYNHYLQCKRQEEQNFRSKLHEEISCEKSRILRNVNIGISMDSLSLGGLEARNLNDRTFL